MHSISDFIETHLDPIQAYVTRLQEAPVFQYTILDDTERSRLTRLAEQLRLTATQRASLHQSARYCKLRHGDLPETCLPEDVSAVSDKRSRNQLFERIRKQLHV
jgi:hypothetical protein